MTTPLRPAPVDYDRTLMLTTSHWRAPHFGTVAVPDALALDRMRMGEGAPDGITRCAGCGNDVATLVQGLCGDCR